MRDVGGLVKPGSGHGGGHGLVECVGYAARQSANMLHLLVAEIPESVDGCVAGGDVGLARVCDAGRGRVRECRERCWDVEDHGGRVVQEVQESVQHELCALQAAAGARDLVVRDACGACGSRVRSAGRNVVESRSAAGARWRATYLHRVYSQCGYANTIS